MIQSPCSSNGCDRVKAGRSAFCNRCLIEAAWKTEEWKARRSVVISKAAVCRRCREPFGKDRVRVVNHLIYPRLEDGSIDVPAYIAMIDGQVEVLCQRCNHLYTKLRIAYDDPWLVCECGNQKKPYHKRCDDCASKA